jgi:hypothetical protein
LVTPEHPFRADWTNSPGGRITLLWISRTAYSPCLQLCSMFESCLHPQSMDPACCGAMELGSHQWLLFVKVKIFHL